MGQGRFTGNLLQAVALLACLACVSSKIAIMKPEDLRSQLKKLTGSGDVPHAISSFGFVDYQANMEIRLFNWPNPKDPCSIGATDPAQFVSAAEKLTGGQPFGLVLRQSSDCDLAAQAIEAKKLGAHVCLAYLEDDSDPLKFVINTSVKGSPD
jgi:hypothetical protein